MRTLLLPLLAGVLACAPLGFAQQAEDDLAVTLPNGRTITFQTPEQKAKFLAARQVMASRAQAEVKAQTDASLKATDASPQAGMGHTALDEKPQASGIVNPTAPTFTAAYYMGAPESWKGKNVTLSVAYLSVGNEVARPDGMRQLTASTYGSLNGGSGYYYESNYGGTLPVLAPSAVAQRLLQLCGTAYRYNGGYGYRTTLIHGTIDVLPNRDGSAGKQYGLIVEK